MNLRELEYLVALADHRHFGKAASICYVSQPALSMQIKKLESYLGIQLLERTNKNVFLTETGLLLAEKAREILRQINEIKEIARLANNPLSGELKMGVIPTVAPYLLPRFMPSLVRVLPELTLYLLEEPTAALLEKLKQGKIDIAVLAMPVEDLSLRSVPLFEEEFLLALPKNHRLAKQKALSLQELKNKQLLLLEEGHCLREQALSVCHRAQVKEATFRATSLETLRHMVANGVGMTLMPKLACQTKDGIAYVSLKDPKPSRTLGLFWRGSTAKEPLITTLAQLIKN